MNKFRFVKLFEDFKKIGFINKEDVDNIFIELIDDNFKIEYDNIEDDGKYEFMLYIEKDELFNTDVTEEYLLVFLDYMKACYNVLSYKYATYRRYDTRTISGNSSFTTDTTYYDDFPNNIDVKTIGIDFIIE